MSDKFIEVTLGVIITLTIALFLFALMMFPISLSADARCLAAGFPKSKVTWNLKAYCLNMDGAVTVKVEELKDE